MRKGIRSVYFGESGFLSHYRGKQHLSALRRKQQDSALLKHIEDCHEGDGEMDERDFVMKTIRNHRRPLSRQSHEGLLLEHAVKDIESGEKLLLMNSKSEFFQPGVVRPAYRQGPVE